MIIPLLLRSAWVLLGPPGRMPRLHEEFHSCGIEVEVYTTELCVTLLSTQTSPQWQLPLASKTGIGGSDSIVTVPVDLTVL